MRLKTTILTFSLAVLFTGATVAQNKSVEFEKENFSKEQKAELKDAVKNIKEGDYLYEGDIPNYGEAMKFYEKAQAFNPKNAMLNYKIGNCLLNSIYKWKALKYFQTAYALHGGVAHDIHMKLGMGLQLNYKWKEAIEKFELYRKLLNQKDHVNQIMFVNKRIEECRNGIELVANPERVWIDNLGTAVNTKYPEYSPFISADESVISFTARRNSSLGGELTMDDHGFYEDIYIAEKGDDGKWKPSKNIGDNINTKSHDATAGLSADGKTLFVYYGNKNGGDIFVSKLEEGEWTKPKRLGKNVNTDKYHETSACLSFDEKRLFFVTDKPGGHGEHDIYYSDWDAEKERWGEAVNIGPVINTKYDEVGVFIHPDGKTMYFSSKGHGTMGGYDIFSTTFEDGKWTKPKNIGYPVSTPDDDVHFVISASGRHGYYSSFKEDGHGEKDLYLITFLGPEKQPILNNEDNLLASLTAPVKEVTMEPKVEVRTTNLAILKGITRDDKTKVPVGSTIDLIDNTANKVVATFSSDSKTGKFLVSLPAGKNYGIAVKSAGYLFHSENFDIPKAAGYRQYEKIVDLKKVEVGSSIVLRNIFFDYDKATLKSESTNELNRLVKLLTENPTIKIELSGHTDSRGSAQYNKQLSDKRAKTAVEYLVKKGIAQGRLTHAGYGEEKLMVSDSKIASLVTKGEKEEAHQENRRTEIKILSK
jgi:outer membrane protein OmpA-like peptidoglycan-associated protein